MKTSKSKIDIRGKFRSTLENPKLQKTAAKIEAAEKKFSFPKTLLGGAMTAAGAALLYYGIPFASELLWSGIGIAVAGLGFKLNRKLLGKTATNKIEKLLIDLLKRGLK